MKKRVLHMFVTMAVIFCALTSLTACGANDENNSKDDTVPVYVNDSVSTYIDPETGVNYLIYHVADRGGITVRYNADGTLYVTEVE